MFSPKLARAIDNENLNEIEQLLDRDNNNICFIDLQNAIVKGNLEILRYVNWHSGPKIRTSVLKNLLTTVQFQPSTPKNKLVEILLEGEVIIHECIEDIILYGLESLQNIILSKVKIVDDKLLNVIFNTMCAIIKLGKLDTFELLLKRFPQLNNKLEEFMKIAASEGKLDIVKYILSLNSIDLHSLSEGEHYTNLENFIIDSVAHTNTFDYLLNLNKNVTQKFLNFCLYAASDNNNFTVMKKVVQMGANDFKDALSVKVPLEQSEMFEFLLSNIFNINFKFN